VLNALAQTTPAAENATTETVMIAGDDGNDIPLYFSRRTDAPATLPCIVHIHGRGMAFLSAADAGFMRWSDNLVATGLVVVGVEFPNSGGKFRPAPLSGGLVRSSVRPAH
jgi:hypothetical protein